MLVTHADPRIFMCTRTIAPMGSVATCMSARVCCMACETAAVVERAM